MPARTIKPRVPSGIVSKSSSKLNLNQHGKQCICQTCTCGNHVCIDKKKLAIKANLAAPKLPLEGSSETKEQFIPRDLPDRKNFKPVVEPPQKRDIESETETRKEFIPKPVPPRPQPHLQKYEKNPAKLEGTSETKDQFLPRELQKRVDFKPAHHIPPPRDIDSNTEIREQFTPKEVPPRPQRRVAKYIKNEALIDSSSETKEQYTLKEIPERKMFKPPVVIPPKRDIESETETRKEFVPKPVPPPPQPHIRKYEKNEAKLEGDSETHQAYPEWPNQGRPNKFKKAEYKDNKTKLEGESVTKTDYKDIKSGGRTEPIKRPSEYHPPTGNLDTTSLYHEQFLPYSDIHPPVKHERTGIVRLKEDREFTTVTGTSYLPVDQSFIHQPAKHIQEYRPSGHKLEGESVLRSDYKTHDLSLLERKDLKLAALVDRQGSVRISGGSDFAKTTEYVERYLPNGAVSRVEPIRPPVHTTVPGKNVKLEGESELHYSYQHPAVVSGLGTKVFERPASFKPPYVKATGDEDRDFSTQTNTSYVPDKACCPAAAKAAKAKTLGEDGHIYFVGESSNNLAA